MTASATFDKASSRASDLGSRASDLGSRASDLGSRAQSLATDTVLPALVTAATVAQDRANETVLPVLQETVLPKVASAASAVVDVAKDRGGELWERVSDNEQAQELARRAALVASGAKGESPRRWPLLVAGIVTGVVLGTLLGRKTAPTPPPAAVDPVATTSA